MIRIIDHEGNGYGAQAEITRKKGVNGEKSLTGVIYTNEEVLHGVDRGWKLEFENEMYAFTFAYPKDIGNRIELEFDAVHEFFYDMSKNSQNNLLNDGSHTFKTYLDFIFKDTGYNYRLDVDVKAFDKQSFGQRNRLDLFYDVIDTAGVEFSVNGSVVRIIERVGNDLSTVVKKGFNLNELRLEKNIGNFVTYQKGFGAWNDDEDHSKGRLEVEYLSPLAEIYGKLDADPVVDERYTNKSSLENRLKSNVEGSYQISVQIDMEDLTRAGYEYKQPHEGDSIMAINNNLGFQRKVRIVSYETDFDVEGNILDHRITCNSIGMVEESILSNNSIKNSIKELQTDLELTRKEVIEITVSADGKSTNYYGPIEPSPDEYKLRIGDTWFDSSGEDTIVKVWNGVEWRKSGADVDAIRREIEAAQQDIAEVKQTADEAVEQIDTAVSNAGFTSLDETISSVQTISNQAQINAGTAIDNALEAMTQASQAVDNTGSLNIRVDEVENTLSVKADKQTVDDLTGVVDLQALDIKANADGLKLKANQDTVDLIDGRVSSLGTEVNRVAGEISNRVWNTDIETAIDGIEVGGRNLIGGFNTERKKWINNDGSIVGLTDGFISDYIDVTSISYITITQEYTSDRETKSAVAFYDENHSFLNRPAQLTDDKTVTVDIPENVFFIRYSGKSTSGSYEEGIKLEKGTKATDWSPAPEDTDAKISHVESTLTQKYDSITGTVSSLDGRVTIHEQTLDSIKGTVSDHTGRISTTEQNVNGLQTTVANKANQSEVTQLANGYNVLVREQPENMVTNGDFSEGNKGWAFGADIDYNGTRENRAVVYLNVANLSTVGTDNRFWRNAGLTAGKKYKITFDAHTPVDGRRISVGQNGGEMDRISLTSGLKTYEVIYEANSDYAFSFFIHDAGTYEIGNIKVVETTAVSNAQLSVLNDNINLRVEKGDVINQINISDENILIQANKIMALGDVVVDGKLTITDEFIAPNAQIDGAKIADATINSAKIASLDVNKLSGNRTQFVQSAWNNAVGGNVSISGSGIVTTASNGAQGLIQNGVFLSRRPNGSTLGYIGYGQEGSSGSPYFTVNLSQGAHFRVRNHLGSENYQTTFHINSSAEYAEFNVNRVHYRKQITISNHNLLAETSDKLVLNGNRSIDVRASNQTVLTVSASSGSGYASMYANLDMKGYHIKNAGSYGTRSERKYKTNITPINNALETVERMKFYEYDKNDIHELGIITDEAPECVLDKEKKTVNLYSYTSLIGKSHQELIERVKELESKVAELKGLIA